MVMATKKTNTKLARKQRRQAIRQRELQRIGQYMIGGGIWFWSAYLIIVFLDEKMPFFWVNLIGNAVGITLNFIIERYWVFKTKRQTDLGVATTRYIIYTGLNAFALNFLILSAFKQYGIGPEYSQFIAAGFFTIWNYYWYKYWVFKGQEPRRRTRHHA